MKILVAGAGGAIGRQLVPQLRERGHTVAGTTRSAARAPEIERLGAIPVVLDALDPEDVARAVADTEPDVIVHQLTGLSGTLDLRHFDRSFAQTNRLRTEATDHLLAAGRAAGIQRFVAQSYAGWNYARTGGPVKRETDPLDPTPPKAQRETLAAIEYLEAAVIGASWTTGIALRYGAFYGPGTSLAPDGENTEQIRARKFPILGDGGGVWSFVHIQDAAAATVAAVEGGPAGIYNVVDDEPAAVSEWLPAVAQAIGAKPPMRLPRLVGRMVAGEVAAGMITDVRGASNEKAKRDLGWEPAHRSWRGNIAQEAA